MPCSFSVVLHRVSVRCVVCSIALPVLHVLCVFYDVTRVLRVRHVPCVLYYIVSVSVVFCVAVCRSVLQCVAIPLCSLCLVLHRVSVRCEIGRAHV